MNCSLFIVKCEGFLVYVELMLIIIITMCFFFFHGVRRAVSVILRKRGRGIMD